MQVDAAKRTADPHRSIRILSFGLVLLLVGVQLASCFRRYIVNDDYLYLYTAWMRSKGAIPGKDFFLASYSAIFDLGAPLFRVLPENLWPLYISRLAILACLVATAFFVARVTRSLFGELAGLLAPVFYLSTQAVLHRGLDVRPDAITTLLWFALFDLLCRHRVPGPRQAVMLGALLGLCFINRFKSVVVVPPLALFIIFEALKEQRKTWLANTTRIVGWASLGVAIPLMGFAAFLAAQQELHVFLSSSGRVAKALPQFDVATATLRSKVLWTFYEQDFVLCNFTLASIVAMLVRRASVRHWGPMAAVFVGTALLSVGLNPAYYAYNLISLAALMAPLAAFAAATLIESLAQRLRTSWEGAVVAAMVLCVPVVVQARELAHYASSDTLRYQRALATFIDRHVPGDAPVFAMEGVGLYRPSVFHWRMPFIIVPWYQQGEWSYVKEFREARPELVIQNYRVPGWLTKADQEFIESHYTALTPKVWTLGTSTTSSTTFEALRGGRFEVETTGRCVVDGQPQANGATLELAEGDHAVHVDEGVCHVRRHYPPEGLSLIRSKAQFEYLYGPDLRSITLLGDP